MANKITNTAYYQAIANAIRGKLGVSDTYTPSQMATAIQSIPTGGGGGLLEKILANSANEPYEYKDNESVTVYILPWKVAANPGNLGLTRVELQACTTIVPAAAFQYCKSLTYADIRKLSTIPQSCFDGCASLETVVTPISEGKAIASIEMYGFRGCSSLTEFDCGPYASNNIRCSLNTNAFNGCSSLETFTCHNNFTIAGGVFSDCTNLEVVDIGYYHLDAAYDSYARFTAGGVFRNDSNLRALVIRNPMLNSITSMENATNFFTNTPIANGNGYIYVPRAIVSAYQGATNWSAYASKFRALEDYTDDGTADGEFILPAN